MGAGSDDGVGEWLTRSSNRCTTWITRTPRWCRNRCVLTLLYDNKV